MKTYYTKCGIEFKKSSEASVTGYKLNLQSAEFEKCQECPFKTEVRKGYPSVFDHWECRAGSEKPNQTDDWIGHVDDKNTIQVRSLHNDFLEAVLKYCEEQPDLFASYNQDLSDCRRAISVGCSQNKKGMAAKKALVEKFFGSIKEIAVAGTPVCEDCKAYVQDETLTSAGRCSEKHGFVTCDRKVCDKFEPAKEPEAAPTTPKKYVDEGRLIFVRAGIGGNTFKALYQEAGKWGSAGAHGLRGVEWRNTPEEAQKDLDELAEKRGWKVYKEKEEVEEVEKQPKTVDEMLENVKTVKTCKDCALFGEKLPESDKHICKHIWVEGKPGLTKKSVLACEFFEEREAAEVPEEVTESEKTANLQEEPEERLEPLEEEKQCQKSPRDKECLYYCKHNAGCALLMLKGDLLIEHMNETGLVDCEVYMKVAQPEEKTAAENTELEVPVSNGVQPFDYSTVDDRTAEFLHKKATIINEIRVRSVVAIGKELKEAQDRLSNNKIGTFGKWTESIGLSRQTVQNYIHAFDYIVKNFDNITDAENIQPSLLFAASKPSAPQELKNAVLNGDITTHKQWKEREDEWHLREQELMEKARLAEAAVRQKDKDIAAEHDKANRNYDLCAKKNEEIRQLRVQLEQAKQIGDPTKVNELNRKISSYQEDIENYQQQIGQLNTRLQEKDRQLKEKPLEIPAVQIKEVVPKEHAATVSTRVYSTMLAAANVTVEELRIIAADDDAYVRRENIIDYYEKLQKNIPEYLNILKGFSE